MTVSGTPQGYVYGGATPLPVPVTVTAGNTSTVDFPFDLVGSAPTISNLSVTLIQLNDGRCTGNTAGGSSFAATFDYTDPDGDVSAAVATVQDGLVFSNGVSDTLVWAPSDPKSVTGNGFSGSVSVGLCIRFGSATSVLHVVTLADGAGNVSNVITRAQGKPPGANTPPPIGSGVPSLPEGWATAGEKAMVVPTTQSVAGEGVRR